MALTELRRPDTSGGGPALLPLEAGEQYRFRFEMDACIGCHSCEVACAEQNANPVGVNWRRVGELEGGSFPTTRRFHLSMGCNHCVEPTCLSGCPTNAYVKLANGVVAHHAEDCIGCQYCIWNCPYEVPVFNPQRRIVTKCDLCQPRLATGALPACVEACPTRALSVEKVDVAAWRADHHEAAAPGLPSPDITLSTTRIVLAESMPEDTRSVVEERLEPADPHWPLVAVTLLTQLALGTLLGTVLLDARGGRWDARGGAIAAAVAGAAALAVSVLHLGRPGVAWKALRNVRRSWLSREVVLFGAFAATTFGYVGALTVAGQHSGTAVTFGIVACVFGVAGTFASGRLYLVPARPVWRSGRTVVAFFATAVSAGPLLAILAGNPDAGGRKVLCLLAGAGTLGQLGAVQHLVASLAVRREREFALSARLLFGRFRGWFAARVGVALAVLAGCLWAAGAATSDTPAAFAFGLLVLATVGEFLGRYLFFVTVTPMTAAQRFSGGRGSR